MRTNNLFRLTFLLGLTLSFLSSCLTQKEKQQHLVLVDSLLKADHFKFVAQQANPLRANIVSPRLQQLNGSYYMLVSKDTVKAYLPYFGVAQQAPYSSSENGIQFTSTDFSYVKNQTKNSYEISIKPKNYDRANSLFFRISPSGSATLNVSSNHRDPISFTGTIEQWGKD